jgi:hypothetical protein
MKKVCGICLALTMIVAFATRTDAQKNSTAPKGAATERQRPLVLSGSIPMNGVKGRFDHFASGQGQVFVSALGNNTVEVISIFGGTVEHTITGVPNPQGVAFSHHRRAAQT